MSLRDCTRLCLVVQHQAIDPIDEDETVYEARQGAALIDSGVHLEPFVRALLGDHALCDEEIAVWRMTAGRGPRVVAILYPNGEGETAVRWL